MMNSSRTLRRAIRVTLAAVATTAGPLALAQTAPAPAATVQDVVVTGSRIQQNPNEVSISPVASISALEMQQSGLLRTEDLLNNLPQSVAEASAGQSISSVGNATISLRGLGSSRTMVLINGRRMAPGAALGFASEPDINQIPSSLVERADVLTGGASAVYGADAVAGVVNFVLNTHYEGVKLDINYGYNSHSNDNATDLGFLSAANQALPPSNVNMGIEKAASILVGANFADGKGNATAYFDYLNSGAAVGYQIDHAACTLNGNLLDGPPHCGGSSTSQTGRFLEYGLNAAGHTVRVVNSTVNPSDGVFRPYSSLTDSYNYGALSYFQRPAERYAAGAFLNYDLTDRVNVYSETMYARNTSQAQYGPSGSFLGQSLFTMHCANPLLNASELTTFCNGPGAFGTPTGGTANLAANQAAYGLSGDAFALYIGRRNVEGGGRQDNFTNNSIRQVLGAKGKLADAWTFDVYGQVSISRSQDIEGNFLGQDQVIKALDVVTDPKTGLPACASAVAGTDTRCVPWNIWAPGAGGPAQAAAALSYMTVPSSYTVSTTEYITDASVTGNLGKYGVKLPSAASGMMLNIGAEYRQEKYDFDPDYIYGNALAEGGLSSPTHAVHGGFHVSELFTEAKLPLIDEKPGAYSLAAEAGYRYSSYTTGVNTNTFKLGLEWAPIQDIRFRGSYNRAVRAPNILDLFNPAAVGAGGTGDPCWGSAPTLTPVQCARTGVTASQYGFIGVNPAAQINTTAGGNPNLSPETADTYSFGFVVQPRVLPNLILSVDYYDIKIKETIVNLAASTILNDCAVFNVASLCSYIHRSPTNGSLWIQPTAFVNANSLNIGTVTTKGVDLKADYRWDIGKGGKLAFDLVGTRVQDFLTEPVPGLGSYDCAGYAGQICLSPTPKWRHNLTTTWMTPWAGLDVTLKWRYIGAVASDRTSSNPQLGSAFYSQTANIPAFNYLDMSASMPLSHGVSFRLGINNIADKNPPAVWNGTFTDCPTSTCNDNTWVGTYDTLGRYYYGRVTAKF